MASKDPTEIAELKINGALFRDWTSVSVTQQFAKWHPLFSFDCTEEFPLKKSAALLQIKPGDVVEVLLAGQLAVSGYVLERHVGYDARQHGVKIAGAGKTWDLTNTSVFEQSGSFDGKNIAQLAQALIGPSGCGLQLRGAVDLTPFKNIQVSPGEIISQCIERYARMRKVVLGSTETGDLLLIGDHAAVPSATLVEGKNILRANALLDDQHIWSKVYAINQRTSDDETNGDKANKQIAMVTGSSTRNRTLVVPCDVSDDDHGVRQRAEMEKIFTEGGKLEAHITVQGWLNGGKLWKAGEYYDVNAPMLMLYGQTLGAMSVTFEQDSARGTTTTLVMVDPQHMAGRPDMRTAPGAQ